MEKTYRGKKEHGKRKGDFSKPAPKEIKRQGDEAVRLNRFIANSGICSRREADQLIADGLVKVNGKVVTVMGTKVGLKDEVTYNGKKLQGEQKVYLLLNKPKNYITSVKDEFERSTVMDLIKNACSERIYPVGRLDRNTTGLLLFTNDGDLTKKLTHPKFEKKKIYHVVLNRSVSLSDMEKLLQGVTLDDGFIKPDAVSYASKDNNKEIGLEIHSGRNRIVRRIFEHLGFEVERLDRVYFAGLTKKDLPRGKWRFLDEKEIAMLKMNSFK